jgi:hypothetical protein
VNCEVLDVVDDCQVDDPADDLDAISAVDRPP